MIQSHCDCGNPLPYETCCGQYIEHGLLAPTPEALMRSRYTAFVRGHVAYIQATMKGKAAKNFNPEETAAWIKEVTWLGLTVEKYRLKSPRIGVVIFETRYIYQNQEHVLREKSDFQKIGEQWFYVEGKFLRPGSPDSQ